jgi:hypothetical protein
MALLINLYKNKPFMKTTLAVLCFVLVLFAFRKEEPKKYNLSFDVQTLVKHTQKILAVRQIIDQSNLPNQQVKFSLASIDSLMMDISAQVGAQMAADTINKKDSVSKPVKRKK